MVKSRFVLSAVPHQAVGKISSLKCVGCCVISVKVPLKLLIPRNTGKRSPCGCVEIETHGIKSDGNIRVTLP